MKICDESKCTGCMACVNVCPQECITIQYNDVFELHPAANDLCVSCGRCQSVCPANDADKHKNTTETCYAAYSKTHREGTSSGGLATALSKYIIASGGVVCGCIFDGDAHHIVTNETALIPAMRGSKYVQSVVGDCYRQLKKLTADRKCLFIGTPCQVAAVKNVVGESENLFCADLICHGTPSPYFLKDILDKYDASGGVVFREKGDFTLKISGNQCKMTERYMTAFLNEMSYRESCYQCPFAENQRVGDVTLGDFWEIKNFSDAGKGVSCVLVNNEKGRQMIDAIKNELYLEERSADEAYAGNPQLCHPSIRHKKRDKFLKILKSTGNFDYAVKSAMKKELFKNWLKKRYAVKYILKLRRGE